MIAHTCNVDTEIARSYQDHRITGQMETRWKYLVSPGYTVDFLWPARKYRKGDTKYQSTINTPFWASYLKNKLQLVEYSGHAWPLVY